MVRLVSSLLFLAFTLPAFASHALAPRDVDITAADGIKLKATYYAAAKPGPAVLLLHMCNSDRRAWDSLGRQLAEAGIHALAPDYRGFGESGGDRFENDAQKRQQVVLTKWPGDVDAAFSYLLAQPGVKKNLIGAAGGSCGVHQAVQVARRHSQVKSLVLLAGGTDLQGIQFLQRNPWLPVFTAAAADDQYDSDAPASMRWMAELSGSPRNQFMGFADGKHGTEIFGRHPELPRAIVAWYLRTLVKHPANPNAPVSTKKTEASEFWTALEQPGGVASAVRMFQEVRRRDPHAYLFPEGVMNQVAYQHMQAGQPQEAVELCKLNIAAYPASANAYDSLGDAYVADGQSEKAIQASEKALELLPADKINEQFKKAIQESAEGKLQKLKGATAQ